MEIYQLQTFVVVAHEGSITRASERLHLSQPAVSAHVKALEETLGLSLFERTARGMLLTSDGQRLLARAEATLAAHRELLAEAARMKGRLTGKLRLGAGSRSSTDAIGRLLTVLADRCPEVEVTLKHGNSLATSSGILHGTLDAGFFNEVGEPDPALSTIEVSRFAIYLAAPPGCAAAAKPLDWKAIEAMPWIGPSSGACCWQAAERLFAQQQIRPKRFISVDVERVTRTLIAGGVGVGLLHADDAYEAQRVGEVELVGEAQNAARVLFAHRADRTQDPLLVAVSSIVGSGSCR